MLVGVVFCILFSILFLRNQTATAATAPGTVWNFAYSATTRSFLVPDTAYYQIELWGANGGIGRRDGALTYQGGKGAYTRGTIELKQDEIIYIITGEAGGNAAPRITGGTGGHNGGGGGGTDTGPSDDDAGGGGGGATDVRFFPTTPTSTQLTWNDATSLRSRIMVAAGGGGSSYGEVGGAGGDLTSQNRTLTTGVNQVSGNAFGVGGRGVDNAAAAGGGGGGGFWGGRGSPGNGTSPFPCSGTGGSSFISGYTGSVAVINATSNSPRLSSTGVTCAQGTTDNVCSRHYSGKIFTESLLMTAGTAQLPNPSGGTQTGHTGNGYARITLIRLSYIDPRLATLNTSEGILTPTFNSNVYSYFMSLGPEQDKITVSATPIVAGATITGIGLVEISPGTKVYNVVSVSTNGDVATYQIEINRPPSEYRYLESLRIDGQQVPGYSPSTLSYNITVSPEQETANISFIKGRTGQVVTGAIGVTNLPFGTSTHYVYVESETGVMTTYTLNITRPSTTKLKELTITSQSFTPTFDSDVYSYSMTVLANIMSLDVLPLPYDPTVSIDIQGAGYFKGSTVVKIVVSKSGLETSTYTIDVTKLGSDFKVSDDFSYTGICQAWTAPANGTYKIETWGAQAQAPNLSYLLNTGGRGAYTSGMIDLVRDDVLYVCVGQQPAIGNLRPRPNPTLAGGWNGGGNGESDTETTQNGLVELGGGGGGATDIRYFGESYTPTTTELNWNNITGLRSRIMVAAGGGGSYNLNNVGYAGLPAGALSSTHPAGSAYAASQVQTPAVGSNSFANIFGIGQDGQFYVNNGDSGGSGGGGGYWGGISPRTFIATNVWQNMRGSGGSSYISGHRGSVAIANATTNAPKSGCTNGTTNTACSHHYSEKIFTDTTMLAGSASMPSPAGGFTTGRTGHGYARITLDRVLSENNFLTNILTSKGSLNPAYNMTTFNYSLSLGVNDTKLQVTAIPEDPIAFVVGNGNYDIPAGDTEITIVVTSESGDIRTYTINVNRPASDLASPIDIAISGLVPSLCALSMDYCVLTNSVDSSTGFNPNIHNYFMTVPARIKDLEFTTIKGHDYQTVIGDGIIHLSNDGSMDVITIEVTSEDGQNTETYFFYIERDMNGNTDLDVLQVIDPIREIHFDPGITDYFISVPNGYTEIGLLVTPSDSRVTPVIKGNENFELGLNIIEIYMQAVNGEEKTYTLYVYRELSGNAFLSDLKVTDNGTGTNYPLTPIFNKILNTYTLTVPNEVSVVDLVATLEASTSSVTGAGIKNLNVGLNRFEVEVTAQDSSKNKYTLNITRLRNSNANLAYLNIAEASYNPSFDKEITEYEVIVAPNIKSLTIGTDTENPTARYIVSGNSNFKVGENTVTIQVIAEDGTTKNYKIIVTKEASENNYLLSLNTDRHDLSSEFDKEVNLYEFIVPNNITDITITAQAEDPLSTVMGTGKYNLATGENSIMVTVVAESGDVNMYELIVTREKNSNADLLNILNNKGGILDPTFDPSVTSYTLSVSHEVDNIVVTATKAVSTSTVVITSNGNITNLKTGSNPITITVTAEDGNIKVYSVDIIRALSDDISLKTLIVEEGKLTPAYNPGILEYTVKVPYFIDDATVIALPNNPAATVLINGAEGLTTGENLVTVTVTAENGESAVYEITVIRQDAADVSDRLLSLTTNRGELAPAFKPDVLYYELGVDHHTTNITISGELEDELATTEGLGTFNLDIGDNFFSVVVTSVDGIERSYQIKVTRDLSDDARLASLNISGSILSPAFNMNNFVYEANVYSEFADIIAIPVEDGAKVEILNAHSLEIGVLALEIIRVTAPNGVTTQDYLVTLNRLPSNNNNLESLTVIGATISPAFSKTTTVYTANVSKEVSSIYIEATAEDPNAMVSGIGERELSPGENIIEVIVTSESGNEKVYAIVINKAYDDNNRLAFLNIDGVFVDGFDPDILSYNMTVTYETSTVLVSGVPENPNASVFGNGYYYLGVGSNQVEVVVYAEDGSSRTYTVNVTREHAVSSKLASLSAFPYDLDIPFHSEILEYFVTVDNEILTLPLEYTTLDPGAIVSVIGNNTFAVGMNQVEIVVTSSDGVDQTTYILNVNRQMYSNTYLAYIHTSVGTLTPSFVKTALSYTVTVPNDVTEIELNAEPEISSSILTGAGTKPLNYGDNIFDLTVTSTTGIKRTYKVNIIREKSANSLLMSLVVRRGNTLYPLSPTFDPTTNAYAATVPLGTPSVDIMGMPGDSLSSISGFGTKELKVGANVFEIKVTAQDGTTNIYEITINRPASDSNFLTDLIPSRGTLSPSFAYMGTNYTINLDSSVSTLSFQYATEDQFATVTGANNQIIPDGTSIRTITVTAEDGGERIYTITIIKDRTDEARLSHLALQGFTFNEPFDSDVFAYTVTVPNDKRNVTPNEVFATAIDPNATINRAGVLNLTTVGTNTYNVVVTAQDGFTKQTYQIIITREKSSMATLVSIEMADAWLDKPFNPSVTSYTMYIPREITKISPEDIIATPTDPAARVAKNSCNFPVEYMGETKSCTITVTSDDGSTTMTYDLDFVVMPSNNTKLSSLSVANWNLTPAFNRNIREYVVSVYDTRTEVSVSATVESPYSTLLSGTGTHELIGSETVIDVFVEAEDGTIGYYRLKVQRNRTDNLNLNDMYISVNTSDEVYCSAGECILLPEFSNTRLPYSATIPNEISTFNLHIIPGSPYEILKLYKNGVPISSNMNNIPLDLGKNNFTVTVENSLGETRDYTLTITRKLSNNNFLDDLIVVEANTPISFNKNTLEYDVEVESEIEALIIYYVTDHPGATVEISANSKYLVEGLNDVIVTVTAPSGAKRNYILHVFRKPLFNNFLQSITVSSGPIYTLTPRFNKYVNSYTITVPATVEQILLEGVAEYITTEVVGHGTVHNLTTGSNVFTLTAIAETGEINIYTINVIRSQANNVFLAVLSAAEGTLDPAFHKETAIYSMEVDGDTDKLNITAIPEDSRANVTILGADSLKEGKNVVSIVVMSADKTAAKTYRINVTKLKSTNNLLADLYTSEGTLEPAFDPLQQYYDVNVGSDVGSVEVFAEADSKYAYVFGTGTYSLAYGENEVIVAVISESGNLREYLVKIHRAYNKNLISLVVSDGELSPAFDKNITAYSVSVPFEIDKLVAIGFKEDPSATVIGNGEYELEPGTNTIDITVKAIDGSTKTYTLAVTREASNLNDLLYMRIREGILSPEFDKGITEYSTMIPNDFSSVTFDIEIPETATYQIIGNSGLVLGDNEVIVRVTAQNGEEKDYTIIVTKLPTEMFSTYLMTLTVNRGTLTPSFDKHITAYAVTVDIDVEDITINATKEAPQATITGIGTFPLVEGKNTFRVIVTSADGVSRIYEIIVYRVASSDARIKSMSFTEGSLNPAFTSSSFNYRINVSGDTYSLTPTIIPFSPGTTVEIIGNSNFVTGENLVTFKSTSADGMNTLEYKVTAIKELSGANHLAFLTTSLGDVLPIFDSAVSGPYTISVDSTVHNINIMAGADSPSATVLGTGLKTLSAGANYFQITVIAENGNVRNYVVVVTKSQANNVRLLSLSLTNCELTPVFNPTTKAYTCEVDSDIASTVVTAIPSDPLLTVLGNREWPLAYGTNEINVIVSDGAGITEVYTVTVNRNQEASSKIRSLRADEGLLNPEFNPNILNYSISIPNEVTSLTLHVTLEDAGASYVVSGNGPFSIGNNSVHITVTATDSTKSIYTINVNRQISSNNYLTTLAVNRGDLSPDFDRLTLSYSVQVDSSTENITIFATAEDPSATIDGDGLHSLMSGENILPVKVTSNSGFERVYTIVVHRALREGNKLISLEVENGTISPAFDPDAKEYTVYVDPDTLSINLIAEAEDGASIFGDGEILIVGDEFTKQIIVTSEDGQVNTYTVNIIKNYDDNIRVLDIIPTLGELDPEFDEDIDEYIVLVPDHEILISFDVITESTKTIVSGNNNILLLDEETQAVITITSADGKNSKEITITIVKVKQLIDFVVAPVNLLLAPEDTFEIEVTFSPSDASNKDLIWVSQDENIATVENGVITGVDFGETTILVTSVSNSHLFKTIYVTVMNLKITSSIYDVERFLEEDEDEDYVIGAEPKTEIGDFIDNFDNLPALLRVYDKKDDLIEDPEKFIGTGMKMTLELEGIVYDTVWIVVRGDINGDGLVNALDFSIFASHLLLTDIQTGLALLAMDTTYDDNVNAEDFSKMASYLLLLIDTLNKGKE